MKWLQEIFILLVVGLSARADVTSWSLTPVGERLFSETQQHVQRVEQHSVLLQERFYTRPLLFFSGTYLPADLVAEFVRLHDKSKVERSLEFRQKYYTAVGLDPFGPLIIDQLAMFYGKNKKDLDPEQRAIFDHLLKALNAIDWQIQVEFFARKGFLKPAAMEILEKTQNPQLIERSPKHLNYIAMDLLEIENVADKVDREHHSENEIGMKPESSRVYLQSTNEHVMADWLSRKIRENRAGKSSVGQLLCQSLFRQQRHLIFGNSY